MPIKFPKFSRRKSSGTVYEPANLKDDREGAREPSSTGFHVLPQLRSSRTTSTSYSGEEYAGSNRLSSSSTLPSADAPRTPDDYRPQILHTKSMPLGSKGFQHQHGYKGTAGPQTTPRGNPQAQGGAPSSGVAPPQLETSLDTSSFFDEDMFNFNGPKKPANDPSSRGGAGSITPTAPKIALNKIIDSNHYDGSSPIPPPKSYNPSNSPVPQFAPESSSSPYSEMFASPQHMDSDRPGSDSPYHWNQPADDLIVSPTSGTSPHTSRQLTPANKPLAAPKHTRTDSLEAPSGRGGPRAMPKTHNTDLSPLSKTNGNRQPSSPVDQDAATVASSAARNRPGLRQSASSSGVDSPKSHKDRDSGWEEAIPSISSSDNSLRSSGSSKDTALTSPMMSRGNTDPIIRRHSPLSNNSTVKASAYLNDTDDYDASMSAAAALANQYEVSGPAKQVVATKVMTKAQFELYQQQQDEHRRLGGKAPDDDDDESIVSEEEETEAERRRETARQRARQDAHLSVYRQQMMKITGTDQSDMPLGMQSRPASVSTSALVGQRYTMQGMQEEEDEDDEIPLGILMAHGFPSRSRPPTRLSNSNSQPNLRQSAQNQAGGLPVFARHLPADPYNVGAGLQNPLNRQSLAFHTGPSDMRSNAGGSVYGGMSNGPARGGLVGEIVKAEEQRAYRKGLTNPQQQRDPFASQDPFARSNSPGGGMMGYGGGQQPQMGGGMDQTGAMQAQMAQQMQQMMQMQMQWMQMQMQGGQPQQPPPQFLSPMGMPGMPGMGQQMPRPNSTMGPPSMNGQQQMGGGLGVPQMQQRPMSMMESQFGQNNMSNYAPSMAGSQRQSMAGAMGAPLGGFMGMQPGYTPSIAPSERSNVGLPPRYRPVSQQPPSNLGQQRSMTLGSGIGHNWQQRAPASSALKNPAVAADEEDEEAGWEELNKKRKEKKDGWRKKKESGFKGMLNFGSTATTPST